MAIGPPVAPPDSTFTLVTADVAVTIGAPDVTAASLFTCGKIRQVYCNGAGTVYLQNALSGAFVPYVVVAGSVLYGNFIAIGGTGTGSTAIQVIASV